MFRSAFSTFVFIAGIGAMVSPAFAFDSSKGQTKTPPDGIAYFANLPDCNGNLLSASDRAPDDLFGYSMAIKGNTVLMGAPSDDNVEGMNAGSIYAFNKVNGTWTQAQKFLPGGISSGDYMGCSLDFDGQYAVFGARYADPQGDESGSVWTAHLSGGFWQNDGAITAWDGAAADQFGHAIAMGTDWIVVSAPYHTHNGTLAAGKVYAYRRFGTSWDWQQDFTLPNGHAFDDLGMSLDMIENTFAAGATYADISGVSDCGAVMIGEANLVSGNPFFATWSSTVISANDKQPNDHFGSSVAMSGQFLYVGAPDVDVSGRANAGAVYVFARTGFATYTQVTKLVVGDYWSQAGDQFGRKIAVNGQDIAISDALGHIYRFWQPDPFVAGAPEARGRRDIPAGAATTYGQGLAFDGNNLLVGDFNHAFTQNGSEGAVYAVGAQAADDCSNAAAITPGVYTGCTWTALNDGSASCGLSETSPDVWYKVVGDANTAGPWKLTVSSDYDSVLSVHTGCPGTSANQIACDDDTAGNLDAKLAFTIQAGQTYLIRVTGFFNEGGAYQLIARKNTCPADIAPAPLGDGMVNVADMLMIINNWGPWTNGADIAPLPNGGNGVNVADLLMVINSWGVCP